MNVEQAVAIDVCSALFINNLLIYSYRKRIVLHNAVSANQQQSTPMQKFLDPALQLLKILKANGWKEMAAIGQHDSVKF